ncbi:fumarate reductase/succinate dehydrogenase flavoprotein domain protein [Arthrobacter sp. FB24]|uniref:FAD-binding dehydrogenase n=1 Tax=Arthrobacter sp. (strain FB24) TaxID=290399 RepID=UPI0000526C6C|nr:FAD-binding dehydrogenase [Arthrobacter sp. FB24]ABK02354.1 fumarate reductase/succinate dehydrogenase flavoprotein domain protein [Arthrobacter sp. FB24]
MDADVIIIGGGLAGLVASNELVRAGKRVAILDQENAANLGGQAFWSLGGLFLVDTPMQRRLGVKDSFELAWQDWQGSAQWDRLGGPLPEDEWAQQWGRAYAEFAAGEKRSWLQEHGITFTPLVGWAERGDGRAGGHGNSVPRFHVPWGTGTGVSEPFARLAREASGTGRVTFHFRHRVDGLTFDGGTVTGVRGTVLAPDASPRGVASNRTAAGEFELRAQAVVIASGGIGGDHKLVRRWWPQQLGTPPAKMITGVPRHVDGRMLDIADQAGVRLVNRDRMWHYTEGIQNWNPVWPDHAIRILPGPSSLWFDALGRRLPSPGLPGYDTLGTLRLLRTTPDIQQYSHSWFILNQRIIEKEFALSGSEQNPDITNRDLKMLLRSRLGRGAAAPIEAFKEHGADFVVADSLEDLVHGMNGLTSEPLLDYSGLRRQIEERDAEIRNPYSKDTQILGIRNSRRFLGDRLFRTVKPHRILDPSAGPLIAVRLHVLTRKTLGGIQTDLTGQALSQDGARIPGLYAAGEAAGFGGGGAHGYNALEGTFLGGCLFTGRTVGLSLARLL